MKTKSLFGLLVGLYLSGCASTPTTPAPPISEPAGTGPIAAPTPTDPDPVIGTTPDPTPQPSPPPPEKDVIQIESGFEKLVHWNGSDPSPALKAFKSSCDVWKRREDDIWLNPNLPEYGQLKDWRQVCDIAAQTPADRITAISFFQSFFEPVTLSTGDAPKGLLTGYYAPQIDVRLVADSVYSEPILAKPKSAALQKQPRSKINAFTSKVLAYGKPIDVFFLQIQGSGQIRFPDGKLYRAAFGGHNSHKYKSIGSVLIARGEMTKDEASKQSIEAWMQKAGPAKAKALMNENPRYIFFKTESLNDSSGPKGSMGVPLTAMGSMAVDPRYHPYGTLVWLETTLPQSGGDYAGKPAGLLLNAQDTGGAIKGPLRGDVYFGSGTLAGEKAGVMKHKAIWTIFLPSGLALKALLVS